MSLCMWHYLIQCVQKHKWIGENMYLFLIILNYVASQTSFTRFMQVLYLNL